MKLIWLSTLTLLFSLQGHTQIDSKKQSFVIMPKMNNNKAPIKSNSSSKTISKSILPSFESYSNKTTTSNRFDITRNSNTMNLSKSNDFANPGDLYAKKLNHKEGTDNAQVYRKNQYLGDFKSKALFLKILCRDHQYVDGDAVNVYVNDVKIRSNLFLDDHFQEIEITLKSGFNKIEFEAINQGTSGPNTAEFQVYDDKGVQVSSNQWNLATGFKASIIVVKE